MYHATSKLDAVSAAEQQAMTSPLVGDRLGTKRPLTSKEAGHQRLKHQGAKANQEPNPRAEADKVKRSLGIRDRNGSRSGRDIDK